MGILQIITRNFQRGSRTRKPADELPYPDGFRGSLVHVAELCTGCATCAYVCSPRAVRLEQQPDSIRWEFFAGQCTFCGRCVEFCPCGALSLKPQSLRITDDSLQLRVIHRIPYQSCMRCGRSIMPLPERVLARLYRREPDADLVADQNLCEDCRRELTGARIKKALGGRAEGQIAIEEKAR